MKLSVYPKELYKKEGGESPEGNYGKGEAENLPRELYIRGAAENQGREGESSQENLIEKERGFLM